MRFGSLYNSGYQTGDVMTLTADGNVGVGTSSPDAKVHSYQSAANYAAHFESANANSYGVWVEEGASANNGYPLLSVTDNGGSTQYFRVDSGTGNVGIGTSSPRVALDVAGEVAIAYDATYGLRFYNQDQNNWSSIGNNIATGSVGANLVFKDATGEACRLDGSGNLLVGLTSTSGIATGSTADNGVYVDGSVGAVVAQSSANKNLYLSKASGYSDPDFISFQVNGSPVGSIGTSGGDFYLTKSGSNQTGIYFNELGMLPMTSGSISDNSRDIGQSSYRWDDIYATNGTIQTSDRNEKQDIAELSDAEQRVAVACKGLLRKFRWKDSVAEKGDEARTHFGIIAQDLQAAFAAEGLDAGDYAMFISTTWTDEETNEEKTRMGVRYSELLAFIIAAI
jgi:hypothetical protein